VTAVGALRLVEQNILSLDEDVNAKLVSWKVPENNFTKVQKVTLRRLLSHSAGLNVGGFPGYPRGQVLPTLLQVLENVPPANNRNQGPVRVINVPGSQWLYSGGGYTVAQQLMIDVTQKPFETYMKEAVLDPLGMNDSTFEQPLPADKWAHAAHGSVSWLTYNEPYPPDCDNYTEKAAAGLWTTPADLAKFLISVQNSYTGKKGPAILSQATAREMLKTQITGSRGAMGLGFSLSKSNGNTKFEHGGDNSYYKAFLKADAATGQGVVIMNSGSDYLTSLLSYIENAYSFSKALPAPELDISRCSTIVSGGSDVVNVSALGTSAMLNYTLANNGNAILSIPNSATLGDFTNCTANVLTSPANSVAAHSTTSMGINVTPMAAGTWSFTVSVASNDTDEKLYNWTVNGTTEAVQKPIHKFNITRDGTAIVDNGIDTVNATMATSPMMLSYTLSNSGTDTLSIPEKMTISNLINCTVTESTLPANKVACAGTTSLAVIATPKKTGSWSFKMSVISSDTNKKTCNWIIKGSAAAVPTPTPKLDITRSGITLADNGSDPVNMSVARRPIVLGYLLANNGTAVLNIPGNTILDNLTNCTVSMSATPSNSVAAGSTTSLVLTVTPTNPGDWSFAVSVPNTDANVNPYNWKVSGKAGAVPELDITRDGIAIVRGGFEVVDGAAPGKPTVLSYTLTNSGTATLSISAFQPRNMTNCTVSVSTPPASSVTVGDTTSLELTVTPTSPGFWSFRTFITNTDPNETYYGWTISSPEVDTTVQ
jgi:CubicO group peptidase (beta-lactamase class C family)